MRCHYEEGNLINKTVFFFNENGHFPIKEYYDMVRQILITVVNLSGNDPQS